ncbi:MAG: hypothetical protein RLZZ303_2516 [Candidatus Hydrogenedentota bacterium]
MSPRTWKTFLTLAAACGLAACGAVEGKPTDEAAAEAARPAEVLIPVEANLPDQRDISDYFETTSRVVAERRVEVLSKGMGECVEVLVEEGDLVTEGQVLARLDRKELEAQLKQTRVTLEMNEYQMKKAREQQEKGILSSFEADNARFAYEQAKATLGVQEIQMENQNIVAPISGTVTQRNIQRGMVVANGMPVFSIVDPNSFVLPITPPEKEIQNLREGQRAEVSVDSAPDHTFGVTVRRINPAVDAASGTVRVLLDFDEADRPRLKDNAFARVKLIMETRSGVLAVQKDTLVEENGRKYLMVLRKEEPATPPPGTAEELKPRYIADRVEVKTGLEDSNYVEITEGIAADSLIVTLGQQTLKPGALVNVTNALEEVMAKVNMSAEDALAAAASQRFEAPRGEDRREKMMR